MSKPKRPILGVVAAEANNIEQRQILSGIIEQAQKYGYDTAVISNVYNPNVTEELFVCENRIYDLILSKEISALILISESFVNESLRQTLADNLLERDVPTIIIGTYIKEFDVPGFRFINTSDSNDIEAVTSHLIEEHSFTDIDLLTGFPELEASNMRVEGYRNALEKHGIPVDQDKIHFGDFWMTSGEQLAEKYISGELHMPQAIVCANDYMAYGMLDKFAKNGVSVPEEVSIVGYEYIDQRIYHAPLLTTYQRNRYELGMEAVKMIHDQRTDSGDYEFIPPKGKMIRGESCPCVMDRKQYYTELDNVKTKQDYQFWNLYSSFDQELTECRNLNDFVDILGRFHWLIRGVYNTYLCLYSNWYDTQAKMSDIMTCRTIMPWLDRSPFEAHKFDFAEFFNRESEPSVYYFNPLFFGSRMFGHIILRYGVPDAYDDIYRNWIKTVSNCLELLRMKNDMIYLASCQNLSEQRDTLTGLYNSKGIENAYRTAVSNGGKELYFVMLRICLFDETISVPDSNKRIDAVLDAAKAVGKLCGNHDICGRINDNTFACIVRSAADAEILSDALASILVQHKKYMEYYGMDSFVCTAEKCSSSSYAEIFDTCSEKINAGCKEIEKRRLISHYRQMNEIRNYVYTHPNETFDTESLHDRFIGSTGYLRSVFKQCFGVSFHKDCIAARISKAKYYLATTTMNVIEISEKCSYIDSKYFLRQFNSITGITPIQYRNLLNG